MKLLILGANGFIGSHASDYILKHRPDWRIAAMDLSDGHLKDCLGHKHFSFKKGDITKERTWIEAQVKECDVVLPLVAIANPATYVKNPLAVFELDFEANLEIVRHCVRYKKRIVFPSTSEVYGMSPDIPYNEESSRLVTGPIAKERWIYSCSKQMMDRVIYAYGQHHGLQFTLFRPFNWFGPRLDSVWEEGKASRVVSQFLSNILHKRGIVLVGGGAQKRCFLYIDDAIRALASILDNKNGCADGRIFNIGDPDSEASIAELAEMMLYLVGACPGYENVRSQVKITTVGGEAHYGKGYQDVDRRVPDIGNAKKHLGWTPSVSLRDGLRQTIAYYLANRPTA
ncbi:MAG: bifunctional UDP-4-keto-pentose/UDP-xylose synthase [Pseudomonadota bacterium]|nr:bifunctional UDP-4-keto-pentose/UDP-xylose synthase [Pseudomonadota bacterium]MDE3037335.1 bifunctional UDP-4-keto-pentose/UDP-xylose synthase [Pseudomonadota bacterium]